MPHCHKKVKIVHAYVNKFCEMLHVCASNCSSRNYYLLPIANLQSSSEQRSPVPDSRPVSSSPHARWPDRRPVQPSQKEEDRQSSWGTVAKHFSLQCVLLQLDACGLFMSFCLFGHVCRILQIPWQMIQVIIK